jgi:Gas vesicle synthesis protein GvpL/GvpF
MTYVYCVIRSARSPRIARAPGGLAGMSAPRVLTIDRGLFAIVSTAPARRYSASAINRGLSNIDWLSRAAVAHEAVVEHFVNAVAVLPMKLFTIFTSDERALDYLRRERSRLIATAKRVANQQEWGVRVLLDRDRAAPDSETRRSGGPAKAGGRRPTSGIAYLAEKKARRDAATELTVRAHDTVAGLFDRLAARARDARRRTASELPAQGSLLLDAAFLVPRGKAASFRALAARESRALGPSGYAISLTGPWPPYTFVQES